MFRVSKSRAIKAQYNFLKDTQREAVVLDPQ
jgi:hypothetical protein